MVLGILIYAGILACLPTDDIARPRVHVYQSRVDFGEVVSGVPVERSVTIGNMGDAPLRIQNIRLTKPLQLLKVPAQIPPGQEIRIPVRLDTASLQGRFEGRIIVTSSDPDRPETTLAIEGNIVPGIQFSPMAAFYVVGNRGQEKQSSIEIINHEPGPLTIYGIEHSGQRFTTNLEVVEPGRRYRLTLSLKSDGPSGRGAEPILIHSSSESHPRMQVIANTYLREKVYTFPEVVDLGSIPIGFLRDNPTIARTLAQTLMVYELGGTDFRVEMRSEIPIRIRAERGPKGDRYQATIEWMPERLQAGPVRGEIVILTNNPEFSRLSVPVTGMILEK